MKCLVREKLATCLYITVPASKASTPPPVVYMKDSNGAAEVYYDGQQPEDMPIGTTDKLLLEIRDLLRMKMSTKA